MFGTVTDGRTWPHRHAWIVALCVGQSAFLAGAALVHHDATAIVVLAAASAVGLLLATLIQRFPRSLLAWGSAATLTFQATLTILVFGTEVRPDVLLLAVICVVGLYESSAVFAATFA